MEILLNPNIAYVLIVVGFVFALLAIITPGTGVLEVFTFILLAVAGYTVYKIGFNLWALVVLLLAVFPFVYAARKPNRQWALVLSLVGIVLGSVYLFPGKGLVPAVNPILAIILSVLVIGFFWVMIDKTIKAHLVRPMHDLENLIGQIGDAKTDVHEYGSVQVAGELWSARSSAPISAGLQVRVTGRDGFVLDVESVSAPDQSS